MIPSADDKSLSEPAPKLALPQSKLDPATSIRRARRMWYGLALVSVLVGLWGVIGGWWFGLPVGGETRRNVFDNEWRLSHLLTTVPDPDFASAPIVATGEFGSDRYWLRNGLSPPISWRVRDLPRPPSLPSSPPAPSKSELAPPSKAPFATQAPVRSKGPQPPSPSGNEAPPPELRQYVTNLRSSSIIVPIPWSDYWCLSADVNCLSLGRAGSERIADLAVPTEGARSAGVLEANGETFAILNFPRQANEATRIYSLVVGSEPTGTVIWLGGIGPIYKLRLV